MLHETLKDLFERELSKLKREIEAYNNEENLWVIDKHIANSAGNLCLHLIGNLNHFIGKELGGTNYVRNRELEFSQKNVSRAELMANVEKTRSVVSDTLNKLKDVDLEKEYPLVVFENKMSTEYFLIHLLAHLTYHLGQVNYHRRLLDVIS